MRWHTAALALGLPSCISDADTFKSKPHDPIEAGLDASAVQSTSEQHDISNRDVSSNDAATSSPWQHTEDGDAAPNTSEPMSPADASTRTSYDAGIASAPATDAGLAAIPPGHVTPEVIGVWQAEHAPKKNVGASLGALGETFAELSQLSVRLEITAEGRYRFVHSASGASSECDTVTRLDESVGTANLAGNVLTLTPASRRITTTACNERNVATERSEIALAVGLTEGHQIASGMRSFVMSAEGYGIPFSLTSLFREPTYAPEQPEPPEDFVLGANGPFARLRGLWVASATDTEPSFYDPATGEFFFPELDASASPNGSSQANTAQRWLRLTAKHYETAVGLQDVGGEGACKLDLVYYERGNASLHVVEDVEGLGWHFVGHVAFTAVDSRLVVNVRECGEHDGVKRYDLAPLTSYASWVYKGPDLPPESLSLVCEFPKSEWQSLLCGAGTVAFVRQE